MPNPEWRLACPLDMLFLEQHFQEGVWRVVPHPLASFLPHYTIQRKWRENNLQSGLLRRRSLQPVLVDGLQSGLLRRSPPQSQSIEYSSDDEPLLSSRFNCNICFESANNYTVITACGHLYCWCCLYKWVEEVSACPVCRSQLASDLIIPVFGLLCDVCVKEPNDPVVTGCGHTFCSSCLLTYFDGYCQSPRCGVGLSVDSIIPLYSTSN